MISLGQLSGILVLVGIIPYIYEIFFRGVKPERATWFVWTAILTISFFAQQSAGAGDSLWLTVGNIVGCAIIFIISIFKGVGGFTRFDIVCLTGALIGVVIWQVSGNPVVAVLGSLGADFAGSVPTLKKAYETPKEEGYTVYIFSLTASILGVAAAASTSLVIIITPIYLVLSNLSILTAKFLGHLRERKHAA